MMTTSAKVRAPFRVAALAAPLALGACLSWLEPDEGAPVAAADRDGLFEAAVAAFAGDESPYRVREMDPVEGTFSLTRVESWRTGDEAIEVDVRLEPIGPGGEHVVRAIATRRSLPPYEEIERESVAPSDASPRFRDEGVERDVLERIRASAERFGLHRAPGG